MRIAIEAQRITRINKHGMDMVALELIKELQIIDKVNEYIIFVKPGEDKSVISETSNFKIVELEGRGYPYWEQVALPRAVKKADCDLLHCTSNTAPLYSPVPLVLTLHDIIYMERISLFTKGGSWYQKLGNMYRRWVVPRIVNSSAKVITVSDFERERIAERFGIGDRLVTVYNGVGDHFRPVTDPVLLSAAREKYRLPDRFFFFLGNRDPKKNTPNVLRAVALFNEVSEKAYHLVMPDYEESSLQALLKEIGYPGLREKIHLCGYINNRELPAIISQASLFLYPSNRESFGIPVLEGMACGVPVITSNVSSMPEVAGDAAWLCNPADPLSIREGMLLLTTSNEAREKLISRGLERAEKFSWKAMAEQVNAIYREVYNQHRD